MVGVVAGAIAATAFVIGAVIALVAGDLPAGLLYIGLTGLSLAVLDLLNRQGP